MLPDVFFRKLSAFSRLPTDAYTKKNASKPSNHIVPKHRDIAFNRLLPSEVHVLTRGWAARYALLDGGVRRIIALLLPGDVLDPYDEPAMPHGMPVHAFTECEVAATSRVNFADLVNGQGPVAEAFRLSQRSDLSICFKWLENTEKPAIESLSHILCEILTRLSVVTPSHCDHLPVIPLKQETIGEMAGMTAVHVNRVFSIVKREGTIETKRGVRVNDLDRLKKLARFDHRYLGFKHLT